MNFCANLGAFLYRWVGGRLAVEQNGSVWCPVMSVCELCIVMEPEQECCWEEKIFLLIKMFCFGVIFHQSFDTKIKVVLVFGKMWQIMMFCFGVVFHLSFDTEVVLVFGKMWQIEHLLGHFIIAHWYHPHHMCSRMPVLCSAHFTVLVTGLSEQLQLLFPKVIMTSPCRNKHTAPPSYDSNRTGGLSECRVYKNS